MVAFTDDDLKRLKEFIKDTRKRYAAQLAANDHKLYDEIESLIARLEAAENLAEIAYGNLDSGHQYDSIDVLYEAWREKAGK